MTESVAKFSVGPGLVPSVPCCPLLSLLSLLSSSRAIRGLRRACYACRAGDEVPRLVCGRGCAAVAGGRHGGSTITHGDADAAPFSTPVPY